MTAVAEIEAAVKLFEGVYSCSSGYPLKNRDDEMAKVGWVKFHIKKSELGWRTLEFLAWVCDDMTRAGERLEFFPTSPPPYLNTPGDCLSFVIECRPLDGDQDKRFRRVAEFIRSCHDRYWDECRGEMGKD